MNKRNVQCEGVSVAQEGLFGDVIKHALPNIPEQDLNVYIRERRKRSTKPSIIQGPGHRKLYVFSDSVVS